MELRKDCQCGDGFNALMGLSCYHYDNYLDTLEGKFQCPHGLELLQNWLYVFAGGSMFQCPHGLELLPNNYDEILEINLFQCPHGLELLLMLMANYRAVYKVSMPSRA